MCVAAKEDGMDKLKTLGQKQAIRYRMIYIAFGFMMAIPATAFILLLVGVDPSSAQGIISTSVASFSAIILGFFATTPKDDNDV